jgi:hypothetical protein
MRMPISDSERVIRDSAAEAGPLMPALDSRQRARKLAWGASVWGLLLLPLTAVAVCFLRDPVARSFLLLVTPGYLLTAGHCWCALGRHSPPSG